MEGIERMRLAQTQLRFAAIEVNRNEGPEVTAKHLEHLAKLFKTPGTFREVAFSQFMEGKRSNDNR
jgi:hypothetical protein